MQGEWRDAARRVVGAKQLVRALREGRVARVVVADDAEKAVLAPVEELCRAGQVPLSHVPAMQEIGHACGIAVGAACAGLLR